MRRYLMFFVLLWGSTTLQALQTAPAIQLQYGSVPVLILQGTDAEMGAQYGQALAPQLHQVLTILEQYYFQKNLTEADLVAQANLFYERFPLGYQNFIQAEAQAAGLSLDQAKILNAMETLGELLNQPLYQCAFLWIAPDQSASGQALIGRNYDYSPPFDQLARFLTVTILAHPDSVPTAFISIAGEIYCPSCVNSQGLFLELNNAMPSGGSWVNTDRQSLLINMLSTLQNSTTPAQIEKNLNATAADFSLIVNEADANEAQSFEFSSSNALGMKFFDPAATTDFVSTNFYLDPQWGSEVPQPTDATTFMGITRRDNLLHLAGAHGDWTVPGLEQLMNTPIQEGGGLWNHTIYQLILNEQDLSLYIKILYNGNAWTQIPLRALFAQAQAASR